MEEKIKRKAFTEELEKCFRLAITSPIQLLVLNLNQNYIRGRKPPTRRSLPIHDSMDVGIAKQDKPTLSLVPRKSTQQRRPASNVDKEYQLPSLSSMNIGAEIGQQTAEIEWVMKNSADRLQREYDNKA